ncbi:MAG: hypothetical protein AB8H86_18735 [Polyangiales bacterium]
MCGAFGCGGGGGGDAGADVPGDVGDAGARDAQTDAQRDGAARPFECEEEATYVATDEPVTRLEWAGAHLLVGMPSALESRHLDLSVVDREESPTLSLSADAGRVAVFDGSNARLFAIDEDGQITASGIIDVSGRSVLGLRESRLFAFRYPLEARINTVEALNIEDLTTPLSLGEVQVEGTGPADVQLDGGEAFALDSVESRLSVIDISDPGAMNVTSTLGIPEITPASELVVTSVGIFVGSANALVHVDESGASVLDTSAGGPLVAFDGARLATASATQVFIYRVSDAGLDIVRTHDVESAPSALLWRDDALLIGSADGIRSLPCAIR